MQFPQLVQAVTLSTWGGRMPRAVRRSAILKTSLGQRARQMPQPSAPLHRFSLMEMITGSFAIESSPSLPIPQAGFRTAQKGLIRPMPSNSSGRGSVQNGQAELARFWQQGLGDLQILQVEGVLDPDQANFVRWRITHGHLHRLAVGVEDHG